MGLFYVRHGMCVRRGAHTGLIGEEAALDALADGGLEGITNAAADEGVGLEGVAEDHADGLGELLRLADENNKAADQIENRHYRDKFLRHSRDTLDAADENERRRAGHEHADEPARHMDGVADGRADGVGLYHAAHKAKREEGRHREEAREKAAEAIGESALDIIDRAAVHRTLSVHPARLLRQHRLGVDGGHAEEGDDPHPENRARAADQDRAAGADDVAGADLRRHSGGQRLKGAQAAGLLIALELNVSEHSLHALLEASDLHKACLQGKKETGSYQENNQDVVGEIGIDCLYQLKHFDSSKKIRVAVQATLDRTPAQPRLHVLSALSFGLRDSVNTTLHLRHSCNMRFSRVPPLPVYMVFREHQGI